MPQSRVLLDDNLRPIWNWLRYSGLTTVHTSRQPRSIRIISHISTALITLSCSLFALFELYRFFDAIIAKGINTNFFLSFLWFSPFPIYCVAQYQYWSDRNRFEQFFENWAKIEKRSSSYYNGVKPTMLYLLYPVQVGSVMIAAFYWNTQVSTESYMLSSVEFLRETFGTTLLALFTSFIYYFLIMVHASSQLIPSFFFSHAGNLVRALEQELLLSYRSLSIAPDNFFRDSSSPSLINLNSRTDVTTGVCRIWERYENIFEHVNEANDLFGILIVTSDLTLFTYVCLLLYGIISFFNTHLTMCGVLTATVCLYVFQIIFSNQLVSHLHISSNKLQSSISRLMSKKWEVLLEDDRNLLNSFHSRLDRQDMIAKPLNLYTITHTNLVSMLALCVSYVIIFLQSTHWM